MAVARIKLLTPAQERLARAAQAAMLGEERRLLERLQRLADEAFGQVLRAVDASGARAPERARGRLLVALRRASLGLRDAVASAVLQGRAGARKAATQRLAAELGQAAKELGVDIERPDAGDAIEDPGLAQGAAESYVAAWRAAMTVAVMRWQDGSPSQGLRTAHETQAPKLERIAATEVPQAYNAAHDEGARLVAEQHQDARWRPLIVKRWDATLDRRTCSVCEDMDGRYTLLGLRFKDRLLPGHVHPYDRCQEAIIVLPLRLRGEVQDEDGSREAA